MQHPLDLRALAQPLGHREGLALVLAQALENANKPFTMLLYPNKTHSISGGRTQVHLFGSLTRFVLENL